MINTDLRQQIIALKQQRQAVILAHNYQRPEIYDVADFIGDSLELSRQAATTTAAVIVFCGVHFMAETAAIVCPDKTVLLPDLGAGCSLAESITVDQLRAWKAEHPQAVVVMYVNTSAEVKAEADYCCTSSNAVKVVQAIPANREILFGPDMFLGAYVQRQTGRPLHIWPGECHVHAGFRQEHLTAIQQRHPRAEIILHPECGCISQCLYMMDQQQLTNVKVLSTSGMIKAVTASPADEFIIGTEIGIIERMKRTVPEKKYIPLKEDAICKYMKKITLENTLQALQHMQHRITVPDDVRRRAKLAIDRMIAIG
ncbi:MAG: quinolinate synthase NadA [Candidatus Kerfeldbacteria bacterium]|nr:quinolinate synthase NadA [Candidatus Kerfeldbacteria bacterium]